MSQMLNFLVLCNISVHKLSKKKKKMLNLREPLWAWGKTKNPQIYPKKSDIDEVN